MEPKIAATESERALLGAIIKDGMKNEHPTVILKAMMELNPIDFTDRKNREMFSVMTGLYEGMAERAQVGG